MSEKEILEITITVLALIALYLLGGVVGKAVDLKRSPF
jgi:hypothetical protein